MTKLFSKISAVEWPKASALLLRVSLQNQIIFTKRLAMLLKSGVPILEALQMLKRQSRSRSLKKIFEDLATTVEAGQSIAKGLERYKKQFGELAINIIRIGELSGNLSENLHQLSEELKKKQALRRKVVSSLIYPAFIVAGTIGITIFLTVYLFPKILPIFQSFSFELPWTTKLLIFLSDTLARHGFLILGIFLALNIGWLLLLRLKQVRRAAQQFILRLPIFGRLSQSYQLANFCRTLGTLLKSNVLIVEALEICAATTPNLVYRREFEHLGKNVSRGKKIHAYLATRPRLFPALSVELLTVSEAAGNLTDTLLYLNELHENEVDDITKNLTTMIEPLLMIFMGGIVGIVALSIITPIYEFTQH